jgi:hypothetical protein
MDGRTIYFEFTTAGQFVRVAALDAETGVEVVVAGPVTASQADLERLARRRLEARLASLSRTGPMPR